MDIQRDMCLFMLGVFDTSGIAARTSTKRTDAHIDAAPNPRHQQELHNNVITCPRSRRAYAGRWELCVVIRLPTERRLDVHSLTTFWRTRARTLERRMLYGVHLARALGLQCFVDTSKCHILVNELSKQRKIDENTLVGPPICYPNETFCFTNGSTDVNMLNRKAEKSTTDTAVCDEITSATVNWESLARSAIDEPQAPLDSTLQTMQSNMLELMLRSTDPIERAASWNVIAKAQKVASGPLARTNQGFKPFLQLRETLIGSCSLNGALDDTLLFQHSDECYGDITEYASRRLERLRIHRIQRCLCGSKISLRKRVRIVRPDAKSRLGYKCTQCGRASVSSVLMVPDLRALKRNVGLGDAPVPLLQIYEQTIDLPAVTPDKKRKYTPTPPIADTDDVVEHALKRVKSEKMTLAV